MTPCLFMVDTSSGGVCGGWVWQKRIAGWRRARDNHSKMVKTYKRFQRQLHVKKKKPTVVASSPLLLGRDNSTLIFCLCRPIVSLHQGQGHRIE